MSTNRRVFSRINAGIPCEIRVPGGPNLGRGVLTSLGFGGACCTVPAELALPEQLELDCALAGGGVIRGWVCWTANDGLGKERTGLRFDLNDGATVNNISTMLFHALQAQEPPCVPPEHAAPRAAAVQWRQGVWPGAARAPRLSAASR